MAYRDKNDPRKQLAQSRYRKSARFRATRKRYSKTARYRSNARSAGAQFRQRHKDRIREEGREYRRKIKQSIKQYINDHKARHGCVDCGEDDPVVLEFDHRDRAEKAFNIAAFGREHRTLQEVVEEIKKCEVRCANCHRRKSHKNDELGTLRKVKPKASPSPQLTLF